MDYCRREAIAVSTVDIQLRVTLDFRGAGNRPGQLGGQDAAFFILGLVQEQLARRFGREHCRVELASATGVPPRLAAAMSRFAAALQQALGSLRETGQAAVDDPVLADMLGQMWPVRVEAQEGGRFLVRWRSAGVH